MNGSGTFHDAADTALQFFCGSLTDNQIIFAAHITHDGIIKGIAGSLYGFTFHHSAHGDHCYLSGTASDIDDHMSIRKRNIDTSTHGSGNGRFEQIDFSCSGFDHGIADGAFFHAGDTAGNAHQNTGFKQAEGGVSVDGKLIYCNDSRLTENQTGILRIDKRFRCSHINCHISFKYQHRSNLTILLFPDRLSVSDEARCIVLKPDPSGSWFE